MTITLTSRTLSTTSWLMFILVLLIMLNLDNNAWSQEKNQNQGSVEIPETETMGDIDTTADTTADMTENMNQAPIATNDTVTTTLNHPVTITVLDNDSDPDSDTLTVTQHTLAANGLVEQQGNLFLYTPNAHFTGIDSFDYTISDGKFTQTRATATNTANVALSAEGDFTDTNIFTFAMSNNAANNLEVTADTDGIATISCNTADISNNTETFTFTLHNPEDGETIATATAIVDITNNDASTTAIATAIAVNTHAEHFTDTETFTFTFAHQDSGNGIEAESFAEAEIIYTPTDNHFSYRVINPRGEEVPITIIAMAMAATSATVTTITAATATVNIEVKTDKPIFNFADSTYTTTADSGKVQTLIGRTHAGANKDKDSKSNEDKNNINQNVANTTNTANTTTPSTTIVASPSFSSPIAMGVGISDINITSVFGNNTDNTNIASAPLSDPRMHHSFTIFNTADRPNTTIAATAQADSENSNKDKDMTTLVNTKNNTKINAPIDSDENKKSNAINSQTGNGGSLDIFVLTFLASLVFLRRRYNLLKSKQNKASSP